MTPCPLAILRGLGRAYPFLKMPTRHRGAGRWVFLVFRPGERDPAWVLKATTDPRGVPALRAERDSLLRLGDAVRGTSLEADVPRLLGFEESDQEASLLESFLGGTPLSSRGARARDAGEALDWLVRFHSLSPLGERTIGRGEISQVLGAAESRLSSATAAVALGHRLSALEGRSVPSGLIHGDFNPHNVLRDGASLRIIDWEDSVREGLASDDVFRYEAVAGFLGRPVPAQATSRALCALGVASDLEGPLRAHYLSRVAASETPRDPAAPVDEAVVCWVRALSRELDSSPEGAAIG